MPGNFHRNTFDEATLLKLNIYQKYLSAWLPVFINLRPSRSWNGKINLFDFFCGPGKDNTGQDGSPLIALKECLRSSDTLKVKNKSINLYFSDTEQNKIKELSNQLSKFTIPPTVSTSTSCSKFNDVFEKNIKQMQGAANLLFIDQCGIDQVNEKVFRQLINLERTDFLFFIASSYFWRFKDLPEFKRHLNVTNHVKKDTPYKDIHRIIADVYKDMIPSGNDYHLAPFSIKKGSNIYGLIFGTHNLLGIEKFLRICWALDEERGEANYDIDHDNLPKPNETLDLFKDNNKSQKISAFQSELENKLRRNDFGSDLEIYRFALENGFLPVKHAKEIVTKLISTNVLTCEDGQPRLSKKCIKQPRKIGLK